MISERTSWSGDVSSVCSSVGIISVLRHAAGINDIEWPIALLVGFILFPAPPPPPPLQMGSPSLTMFYKIKMGDHVGLGIII